MISDEVALTITKECDFDDYTFASPHNMSVTCNEAMSEANYIVGEYINNYDVILDVCYPSIVEQELRLRKMVFSYFYFYFFSSLLSINRSCATILNNLYNKTYVFQATKMSVGVDVCMTYERAFYFNLPEVQKALHANRTGLDYRWTMCSRYADKKNPKNGAFDKSRRRDIEKLLVID